MYRESVLSKLPRLQALDEEHVSTAAEEFYGVIRDSFETDVEPPLLFFENYSWSKGILHFPKYQCIHHYLITVIINDYFIVADVDWRDLPKRPPLQLDTSTFKGMTKQILRNINH